MGGDAVVTYVVGDRIEVIDTSFAKGFSIGNQGTVESVTPGGAWVDMDKGWDCYFTLNEIVLVSGFPSHFIPGQLVEVVYCPEIPNYIGLVGKVVTSEPDITQMEFVFGTKTYWFVNKALKSSDWVEMQ